MKRHVGELAAQHLLDISQHGGVAAQHAMLAADPEIARAADWIGRRLGRFIEVRRLVVGAGQQPIDFGVVEAEQIEVECLLLQRRQLGRQHLVIPACVGRDLVIRDHQRAPLRRRQVRQHDHRRLG